jgi:predicted nuclease of predicted toxin-antitoxin system
VSLAILVDMNLSPDWVPFLQSHGHTAVHWSTVGDIHALDPELMDWARANSHIIFTHDLDFGTILAQTHATGPSVVLIRAQDPTPPVIGVAVAAALQQCEPDLRSGALVVVDPAHHRIRILPI